MEASYWQALNPKGTAQSTGTDGPSANAKLCEVYYFHTDQVGLPEELSNAQGQIIWQAQYKTWGSTVEERWEARRLHGAKVQRCGELFRHHLHGMERLHGVELHPDAFGWHAQAH